MRQLVGSPSQGVDATQFARQYPKSVGEQILFDWAKKLGTVRKDNSAYDLPVDEWIEKHITIDRPRDPVTGDNLPVGTIRLAEYQKAILKEAFKRDSNGKLIYETIVWSEPKKSGKTAIAAAVGMYIGWHNPASVIYCLANDGKQSQDRIFRSMSRSVDLHKKWGGCLEDINVIWTPPSFNFPNGTHVEAIPCDAAGEAGSEPLATIWSELWGFRQQHKERLWTEMTIPPTLSGYAMRWVESYAGYEDESTVLWNLYDQGVNKGRRHEGFPDLPVYVNDNTKQLTFWSHEARMPWQTKDYYLAEAGLLLPNEFQRTYL